MGELLVVLGARQVGPRVARGLRARASRRRGRSAAEVVSSAFTHGAACGVGSIRLVSARVAVPADRGARCRGRVRAPRLADPAAVAELFEAPRRACWRGRRAGGGRRREMSGVAMRRRRAVTARRDSASRWSSSAAWGCSSTASPNDVHGRTRRRSRTRSGLRTHADVEAPPGVVTLRSNRRARGFEMGRRGQSRNHRSVG